MSFLRSAMRSETATRPPTSDIYPFPVGRAARGNVPIAVVRTHRPSAANLRSDAVELEAVGAVYRVEKFCPHAGGNLEHARIENGVLTCPFHGWKFRVADGKCLTAQCRDLDITEIYRR